MEVGEECKEMKRRMQAGKGVRGRLERCVCMAWRWGVIYYSGIGLYMCV